MAEKEIIFFSHCMVSNLCHKHQDRIEVKVCAIHMSVCLKMGVLSYIHGFYIRMVPTYSMPAWGKMEVGVYILSV